MGKKLGFPIRLIDIRGYKIDSTILDTYEMVVTVFLLTDKLNHIKLFKKPFLIVNISPEIVFEMFFFILSNANIDFLD